jgi:hypothetical protein
VSPRLKPVIHHHHPPIHHPWIGFHARAELLPALLNSLENLRVRQLKRERLVQPHLMYRYDMILCQEPKVSQLSRVQASMGVSTPFSASSPSSPIIVPFLFRFNALTHESTRQIGSSVHVCLSYPAIPHIIICTPPLLCLPPKREASTGAITLAAPWCSHRHPNADLHKPYLHPISISLSLSLSVFFHHRILIPQELVFLWHLPK